MRDATAACQGPPDNAHDKEGEIFQWPVCVCVFHGLGWQKADGRRKGCENTIKGSQVKQ